MSRPFKRLRRFVLAFVASLPAFGLPTVDCLDHDAVKRFRESAGPGLVEGFGSALTDPQNAEAGLRQAGAAIFQGVGGIIQTRTPSSLESR